MKVRYVPKNWKPYAFLNEEILALFTLLQIIEPVDNLTLKILKGDSIQLQFIDPRYPPRNCWAAYRVEDQTLLLPAYRPRNSMFSKDHFFAFTLHNLLHEYVHAIRHRDGRKDINHRGHPQEMVGLFNKLMRET